MHNRRGGRLLRAAFIAGYIEGTRMTPLQKGGRAFLFVLAGLLASQASAGLPVAVDGQPLPTLAPMLKNVTPGVVNISTRTLIEVQQNPLLSDPFFRRFFDLPKQQRQREAQSLGSGVIVDADRGYILTNNHVIDKADEITVTLHDGRKLNAELVGTDPGTDVAVIRVENGSLTALPMADSELLQVGDFVVAIGSPFGLSQTVTSGIVSALGRSGLGIEGYEDFIQTDASINPGNSGGALVNLRGELVGINTAIVSRSGGNVGIGFAIPINMASKIMEQLVSYGKVDRGQLGGIVQDLTPELASAFGLDAETRGAVVVKIIKDSPAQQAGMQLGDIVVAINGNVVQTAADVHNTIGLLRVGQKVGIDVLRKGKKRRVYATIAGPQEVSIEAGGVSARLTGAEFGDIDPGSPLYGKIKGVLVRGVKSGSPASHTGLRQGDVITAINKAPLGNVGDLLKAINNKPGQLLLEIRRGRASVTILLR